MNNLFLLTPSEPGSFACLSSHFGHDVAVEAALHKTPSEDHIVLNIDGKAATLTIAEAMKLREVIVDAVEYRNEERAPKPVEQENVFDGIAVRFYHPAVGSFGPYVYFDGNVADGYRFNTAKRSRDTTGEPWDVYNILSSRRGKMTYPSAGEAVAHRMGISGMKGSRFATAINLALEKFVEEVTASRKAGQSKGK